MAAEPESNEHMHIMWQPDVDFTLCLQPYMPRWSNGGSALALAHALATSYAGFVT